jgi:hypothetical protein
MSADHNPLFGILAEQLDFVSKDAPIVGKNAWLLDNGKPFGDIFHDQGQLTPDRLQLLTALVAEHLWQHEDDPQLSLAALSWVPHSPQQRLAAPPDEAEQQSITHVASPVSLIPSGYDCRHGRSNGAATLLCPTVLASRRRQT